MSLSLEEFKANADHEIVPATACPDDAMILDAGPATISQIAAVFAEAKTLVWNGPLGAFELSRSMRPPMPQHGRRLR